MEARELDAGKWSEWQLLQAGEHQRESGSLLRQQLVEQFRPHLSHRALTIAQTWRPATAQPTTRDKMRSLSPARGQSHLEATKNTRAALQTRAELHQQMAANLIKIEHHLAETQIAEKKVLARSKKELERKLAANSIWKEQSLAENYRRNQIARARHEQKAAVYREREQRAKRVARDQWTREAEELRAVLVGQRAMNFEMRDHAWKMKMQPAKASEQAEVEIPEARRLIELVRQGHILSQTDASILKGTRLIERVYKGHVLTVEEQLELRELNKLISAP